MKRYLQFVLLLAAHSIVALAVHLHAYAHDDPTVKAPPRVVAELRPADIANPKGDGPDGKGNTEDDTWQFWFELIHAKGKFARLSLHTAELSAQQRKDGIKKKVRGPIANMLPHPTDTEGWIYHRDWDGRFDGIWADRKTAAILVHPYTEKTDPGSLAITYKVPASGRYHIAGAITDLQVAKGKPHDGVRWRVEKPLGTGRYEVIGTGGPIGDDVGPNATQFGLRNVALQQGDLLRLVIDPGRWWGTDLTRIDYHKIERADDPK